MPNMVLVFKPKSNKPFDAADVKPGIAEQTIFADFDKNKQSVVIERAVIKKIKDGATRQKVMAGTRSLTGLPKKSDNYLGKYNLYVFVNEVRAARVILYIDEPKGAKSVELEIKKGAALRNYYSDRTNADLKCGIKIVDNLPAGFGITKGSLIKKFGVRIDVQDPSPTQHNLQIQVNNNDEKNNPRKIKKTMGTTIAGVLIAKDLDFDKELRSEIKNALKKSLKGKCFYCIEKKK